MARPEVRIVTNVDADEYEAEMEYIKDHVEALNKKFKRNSYELVREFHDKFGHPVADRVLSLDHDIDFQKMRLELIREEFAELLYASGYSDAAEEIENVELVKIEPANVADQADALGDLEYVVNGMALSCGIDLPAVVREIHRSNMTKLDTNGEVLLREDGKILKGSNYEPPNIEGVLGL